MITPSYAGISFGDSNADSGKLTVSGYVRANYQDKDYGEPASEHKIRFDAAQLKLDYERGKLFGHAEYRCYQYDTLCDFSTLIDAYAGYHLNETDQLWQECKLFHLDQDVSGAIVCTVVSILQQV
jgi:hypothetical protein